MSKNIDFINEFVAGLDMFMWYESMGLRETWSMIRERILKSKSCEE